MVRVLLTDGALFAVALGGLAAPWLPLVRRWPPLERLTLALGLALLSGYLAVFAAYLSGASLRWFWVAPLAGWLVAGFFRHDVLALWRQRAARSTLSGFGLLALWCLGWHALIVSYSGAAWQVDWWEHYDRAHFFLAHWPRGVRFAGGLYPLTTRPPLVNLWSAALMSGGGGAFFHHQVFMTLLSCLVWFPLVALVRRWRGHERGGALLLIVLMCSPLLLQNATFPWTKLVAAFFILTAWLQLTAPAGAPHGRLVAAAVALAGGMLAHYSAGPWICALGAAWLATRRHELRSAGVRRELGLGVLLAGAVLATWIGWAIAQYGVQSTFADNTTVAYAPGGGFGERLLRAGRNLFHTVVPVSIVGLDHLRLQQESALGRLRDGWFLLYQLKLWWALGVAGGTVLVVAWWRERPGRRAAFAIVASVTVIVLGTATHSQPDQLGLTHIALQPLVLLTLAWLAARGPEFPRWLGRIWAAGLAVDFLFGIAFHFAIQSGWLDRWLRDVPPEKTWDSYTGAAAAGFENKVNLGLRFLGDLGSPLWAVVLLVAVATIALRRGRREMTSPHGDGSS